MRRLRWELAIPTKLGRNAAVSDGVDGRIAALTSALCAVLRVIAQQQPDMAGAILAALIDDPPAHENGLPVMAALVRALTDDIRTDRGPAG